MALLFPPSVVVACAVAAIGVNLIKGAAAQDDEPRLKIELAAPFFARDVESAPDGKVFVRHPWAVRDREAEIRVEAIAESKGEAPPPSRNVVTRDGVEFIISASPLGLPPFTEAGLQVNLYSLSLTSPEQSAEKWMQASNLPSAHNPMRMTTLFAFQYTGNKPQPDELGDACFGEAFQLETCVRVASCLRVVAEPGGGGTWRVAASVQWATNYRAEVYLRDLSSECKEQPQQPSEKWSGGARTPDVAWWAPPIADHVSALTPGGAVYAAYTEFRLLYVNKVSWWWGHQAKVQPTDSWVEMIGEAMRQGQHSEAARAVSAGSPALPGAKNGLWLEFGVGSGKTTAVIAWRLKYLYGEEGATLHGFDSFEGLPTSWEHTKLVTGTFSMGGEVPQHLTSMQNVRIHVGLFSKTLSDLDEFGPTPVAFAHVDVDLYSSAVEVLSRIACQLYPGSAVVFDELVNFDGFHLSGEYRAWEYVAAAYEIRWDYLGLFWQQAVPIVILERGRAC
eukprot:TRINITY_DN18806_c0_g2_i1.p1 TRINITY_DN18806_c0_g2~~TRINITY_DN18806_c0_g2_i1.p1  ORF type:complete len:505 (-),score=78.93 TRINITY_DN18806_c0_g2_i1:133-1647(-)